MTPATFLQGWTRPLLVLHALCAMALLGATTHLSVVAVRMLRGHLGLGRLARVYSWVLGPLFVATFGLGLLVYPTYRYFIRGIWLDRYAPWASNLFDIKENFVALGLPLALALFFFGRRFEPRDQGRLVPWFSVLVFLLWGIVAMGAVSGLFVTSVHGV